MTSLALAKSKAGPAGQPHASFLSYQNLAHESRDATLNIKVRWAVGHPPPFGPRASGRERLKEGVQSQDLESLVSLCQHLEVWAAEIRLDRAGGPVAVMPCFVDQNGTGEAAGAAAASPCPAHPPLCPCSRVL